MNRFCISATRNSAINEMRFFSPVGFWLCSWPAVTAALLGRWLPALNPTSGSSSSDFPRQARRDSPLRPCDSPVPHLCPLRYASCRAFWIGCWWRIWFLPKTCDPVYSWDEAGRFSSTLAALLRATGLANVSTIPFVPLRSPSSTSRCHMCPLWNGNPAPLKKRQPGADQGHTYANVDTTKYRTRRGGKKSLRGKQIG